MKNINYWKQNKQANKNKIVLILSGIFYRTFNEDSRFLSDKFGFRIKKTGGYEVVGFPKNALKKYLNKLKKENFGYVIYEKDEDNIFYISKLYKGGEKLSYNKDKLIYLENKKTEITKDKKESNFERLLVDINKLILKYK